MGAGASAETHQSPLQPEAAASKKEQGNEFFRAEEWSASELAYTEAIALVNEHAASNAPTTIAILWSNRSAARFKLGNPGEALADALVSISLHPRWYKAYWRAGQAAMALEQFQLAREYLVRAKILTNGADPAVTAMLSEAMSKRPVGLQDGPGSLLMWGQLPSKENQQHMRQRPKVVDHLRGKFVTEVAAGAMHTLALTPHGVYAWGSNEQGQCGVGVSQGGSCIEYPQLVPSLIGIQITTISCGVGHSVAVDNGGTMWCWGIGGQGQLGLGQLISCVPTPTAVL